LLLHEDLYSSMHGDGSFCTLEILFFDSEFASNFKEKHDDRERYTLYHVRSGSISLKGNTLACDIRKYVFDHFKDSEVFIMAESALTELGDIDEK